MVISAITHTLPAGLLRVARDAYSKPFRAYHSWHHVQQVLRYLDQITVWHHPVEVALAALFHDAIYVAGQQDNETLSADLALETIDKFLATAPIDRAYVKRLIELTAFHGQDQADALDSDQQHFLDADMAILGADAAEFDAYDAAIEVEYAHIPKEIFKRKRQAFFASLLDAPRIFLSDHFYTHYERQARENLNRKLN